MKKLWITILLFIISASIVNAAGTRIVVDSVQVTDSDMLAIDFHAEGLIDDKIIQGLTKGRTSTLEYKIQLWGKKAGIINQLYSENYIRFKVSYDFWEKKYVIVSQKEHRLTNSIETIREKASVISNHIILDKKELSEDVLYVISIDAILKPLSVENYEEIKRWLNGEISDMDLEENEKPEAQEEGQNSGILRMFMAITGFGDKIISGKTEQFSIVNDSVVFK